MACLFAHPPTLLSSGLWGFSFRLWRRHAVVQICAETMSSPNFTPSLFTGAYRHCVYQAQVGAASHSAHAARSMLCQLHGDLPLTPRKCPGTVPGPCTFNTMVAFHRQAWQPHRLRVLVVGGVQGTPAMAASRAAFEWWRNATPRTSVQGAPGLGHHFAAVLPVPVTMHAEAGRRQRVSVTFTRKRQLAHHRVTRRAHLCKVLLDDVCVAILALRVQQALTGAQSATRPFQDVRLTSKPSPDQGCSLVTLSITTPAPTFVQSGGVARV